MLEYRHNLISNRWVIIASRRGSRPHDFALAGRGDPPDFDPECPFCPGNEQMTPLEIFALRPTQGGFDSCDWSVRVIPNKFPFLDQNSSVVSPDNCFGAHPAVGLHEVLIESPSHNVHFGCHEREHACSIVGILRGRYNYLAGRESVKHVSIFCNHGQLSGASLGHPHFQIAAAGMMPVRLIEHIKYCRDYLSTRGRSVFDVTIENELASGERTIAENKSFLALCPSASMCPFEVYVLPRVSQSQFGKISDEMICDLVDIVQPLLKQLGQGLNRPDYNLVFHTAGVDNTDEAAFRWYLQLYPRLTISGGYELATDIYVNSMSPEAAAGFYRGDTQGV